MVDAKNKVDEVAPGFADFDDPDAVASGVESEDSSGGEIVKPFNPAEIRVGTKQPIVDAILRRISNKEIDLSPDFQRADDVWGKDAQSRLIESMLIRIPLPAFYMDASDDDRWLVVDGLQRLTALRHFVLDKSLALQGLEFLKDLNGFRFDQLARNFQRRIEETQLIVYVIEKGTPPEVKYNIFKRINTGGMPLSAQEIRHALNQGPATKLLKLLADSREFKTATYNSIRSRRMVDREFVLRFLAFVITHYTDYTTREDLDTFLNATMARINQMTNAEIADLKKRFKRASIAAKDIFGWYAFRKQYVRNAYRYPINRALFEVWTVCLDGLTDQQLKKLIRRREMVQDAFVKLMNDSKFESSISQGTGDIAKVKVRFSEIEKLIQEIL